MRAKFTANKLCMYFYTCNAFSNITRTILESRSLNNGRHSIKDEPVK